MNETICLPTTYLSVSAFLLSLSAIKWTGLWSFFAIVWPKRVGSLVTLILYHSHVYLSRTIQHAQLSNTIHLLIHPHSCHPRYSTLHNCPLHQPTLPVPFAPSSMPSIHTLSIHFAFQGPSTLFNGAIANSLATLIGHYPWFLTYNYLSGDSPTLPYPTRH